MQPEDDSEIISLLSHLKLERRGDHVVVAENADSWSFVERGIQLKLLCVRNGKVVVDESHDAVRQAKNPLWSEIDLDVEAEEDLAVAKLLKKRGSLLDMNDLSPIRPYIVLTGKKFACAPRHQLIDQGYTHHLNVALELLVPQSTKIKFLSLDVHYKVRDTLSQRETFEKAADFIDSCRKANGKCLVNCARGRSRSVAVVLYYLMSRENMSLRDAYVIVKNIRPLAGPSRHLMPQLLALEIELRGRPSFTGKKWAEQCE